jgi:hypothetical protein
MTLATIVVLGGALTDSAWDLAWSLAVGAPLAVAAWHAWRPGAAR